MLNYSWMYVNYTNGQRFVGKTNFSIWRHGVIKVYFLAIIITNLNTVYAMSVAEGRGEDEKGNLLFTSKPKVHTQFG